MRFPAAVVRSFVVTLVAAFFLVGEGRAQVYEGQTLVEAELLADVSAVVPGQPFQVGLRLQMAPGWHTYWKYAGDAGLPTRIDWSLPEGFEASDIVWPLPLGILEAGDIQVYAYKDEVLLLTTITPPADLSVNGDPINLAAAASWLVCEEICIPGSAQLGLSLPVAAASEPANTEIFETFTARVPSSEPPSWPLEWRREGGNWVGVANPGTGIKKLDFFPLPAEGQLAGHPVVAPEGDTFRITISADGPLAGVLAVTDADGERGWTVSTGDAAPAVTAFVGGSASPTVFVALLYGLLGGLILNLMPCVLPVISLKIFGFVRQAAESPRRILMHGLAFSSGIFVWFLGLGAVVAVLRARGQEATWAFQFQDPVFNLVIATIVFVFALNMFGVFEITLPGKATGSMSDLGAKEGYGGSFFQGMFATLLATPCTGPFLGIALGFAFTQPPLVIMAMFASVALGMALPYLVLSARPGWMKHLPKPGPWMERLKQFMGFPLLATLLWLLYIVAQQTSVETMIWSAAFLLGIGLACWIYGTFCGYSQSKRTQTIALAGITASVVMGVFFLQTAFAKKSEDGIAWVDFSQASVSALLAEGKPVFIDFTADWCITCKYNEKTALDRPAVAAMIREKGIVPVKADWTSADPEITAALKEFGRVGVPFYVLYPAGRAGEPVTFPEFITEQMVLDAFAKAG